MWDAEGILSGSDRLLEDNPYLQPFKAPFKIPLDRISKEDLIGSSSGSDQTVVQVTL